MPPPLAFPWKPALRLGAGLLLMALTAPDAHSAVLPCDPALDRLPPPGVRAGPNDTCDLTG
ncbi:hypothetical protein FIU86_11300 [Roseovarius sp. THAF9]|uniref:hypothetical protein n=1 Tax=Roseovarius sp. THAF9 TaxID=2587847 RepID=UPI001268F3A7|nr:hypothetical protein [Roseovarius sp. THAF9]QFT93427.1 hypothetical protein FIU86_11300 [Roseovarius sp. THAF9]